MCCSGRKFHILCTYSQSFADNAAICLTKILSWCGWSVPCMIQYTWGSQWNLLPMRSPASFYWKVAMDTDIHPFVQPGHATSRIKCQKTPCLFIGHPLIYFSWEFCVNCNMKYSQSIFKYICEYFHMLKILWRKFVWTFKMDDILMYRHGIFMPFSWQIFC